MSMSKNRPLKRLNQSCLHFPDRNSGFFQTAKEISSPLLPDVPVSLHLPGISSCPESLYLRKPVLAYPQKGQYEQRLNTRMLKASGWGRGSSLNSLAKDTSLFIDDLDRFPFKADPFHQFLMDDHTGITANMISSFFEEEKQKSKLSPRINCDYFQYFPEKLRG